MLKVHSAVTEPELVLEEAKRLGLLSLEEKTSYNLRKLGGKTDRPSGFPHAYNVIDGHVMLIGGKKEDGSVWITLYFQGRGMDCQWFRTSPILSFTKMGSKNFELETENSFYLISS